MAHLVIEMSETVARSINAAGLCDAVHHAMGETGIFPLAGIRVRAYRAEACAMADKHPENGFVTMTMSVGHGRTKAVLAAAGEEVFAVAKEYLHAWLAGPYFGLTLEIREIDPELTWKANTIRPRLLAKKGSQEDV